MLVYSGRRVGGCVYGVVYGMMVWWCAGVVGVQWLACRRLCV